MIGYYSVIFCCDAKMEILESREQIGRAKPMRKSEPTFYCEKCGAELELDRRCKGFDRGTGKPVYKYVWLCPNRGQSLLWRLWDEAGGHTWLIYPYDIVGEEEIDILAEELLTKSEHLWS